MTTLQVVNYANQDQLSTGASDIDLEVQLRNDIIPKFEMDVGITSWRRATAIITMTIGTRAYSLPSDFDEMLELTLLTGGSGPTSELVYVGENTTKVSATEADTVQGRPDGFWFSRVAGPPTFLRQISYTKIPDAAYVHRFGYVRTLEFADYTTAIELDNYIPRKLQWALVDGLRAKLLAGRFGVGDPRHAEAKAAYRERVDDAIDLKEPGRRNALKRVGQSPG